MFTKGEIMKAAGVVADINHDRTQRQAFMNYSGHVEGITISVYPYGWEKAREVLTSFTAYKSYDLEMYHMTVGNGEVLNPSITYLTLDEMLEAVMAVGKETKDEHDECV